MVVPGYARKHITENKIRDEQGESIRMAYWDTNEEDEDE
jgi:hypothetical protein